MENACAIQEILACIHLENPHIESRRAVYHFQQKQSQEVG